MKRLAAWAPLIALFMSMAFIAFAMFKSCSGPNIDWTDGIEGVGTISKLEYGKGSSNTISYEVDGRCYQSRCAFDMYGITLGEKYALVYLPKDPSIVRVMDWMPVFTNRDSHRDSEGIIQKIFRFKFWGAGSQYGIRFTYYAYGKEYEREQLLPPGFNKVTSDLKEGQTYLVWYDANDPQRAIIYLNKPK